MSEINLTEGRALLEAMRAEGERTTEHEPRPHYVAWLVWARRNAEAFVEVGESIVGDLADLYAENARLLEMLNRANAAEAKAHAALEAVRRLVDDHLLGEDVPTNALGRAFLAALAISR